MTVVRYLPVPANDTLPRSRHLTETDIRAIVRSRAFVWATIFDSSNGQAFYQRDPTGAVKQLLLSEDNLQREIVWRGSWLDREVVDRMDTGHLALAVGEIIYATRSHDEEAAIAVVFDELRRYSRVLQQQASG